MLRYANQKLAAASEVLVKFLALLWSPLRALLRALVGSWQPPGWLRWSLCRLASGLRWLQQRLMWLVVLLAILVATVQLSGNPVPTTLQVEVDDTQLQAHEKDATRVIVRALDQAGRLLPFMDDVVHVEVTGAAKLLGPDLLTLKGGTTGFWLETTGAVGDITLRVSTRRMGEQRVTLQAA